jgi:hypothetical protein
LIIFLLSFLRYFNLVEKFLPTLLKGYFRKVRFEADLRAVLIVLTFTTAMWFFEAGFPWLTTTSFDIRVPLLVVFGPSLRNWRSRPILSIPIHEDRFASGIRCISPHCGPLFFDSASTFSCLYPNKLVWTIL